MASVLALQDYRNRFWQSSIAIRKESKAEGKAEVVKKIIEKMGLSDAQVSDITGMDIDVIAKIRAELKK